MFSTILVPLDGSDLAVAALPAAKAMASKFGAKLVLLTVVETGAATLALGANAAAGGMTDPAAITTEVDAHVEAAKAYLSATVEQLAEESLAAEFEVRGGSPGGAVVDAADESGAELIVMSSHGRGGLGRLIFGSVAEHVVRHATMPVMIIRVK
jgi:nucleotide-binding universal stress UspA family protein